MNIPLIITVVIIIVLLYILWVFFRNSGAKLVQNQNLNSVITTPISSVNDTSTRYAYSVWIYVNSWNANSEEKTIFARRSTTAAATPTCSLYLDKSSPIMYLNIGQTCGTGTTATPPIAMSTNFPVQKWCHVAFSVDGQYVDCYIDGKLVKSVLLNCPVSAPQSSDGLYLGNATSGNDIYLSGLFHWVNPLTPQEVWNKYLNGNGSNPIKNSMNTLGLGVTVFKNNVESGLYRVF